MIEVIDLVKIYKTVKKSPGIGGALKNLVRPEFASKVAVNRISFRVEAGDSVAFVGPNGAGKSTTFKILTGVLHPTTGTVIVNGLIPHKNRIKNNRNIGAVFGQRTLLWWDIPVRESLRLLADMYSVPREVFRRNFVELVELLSVEPLLDKPVRQLSLGQRMRCDLVAMLLHNPQIVFMDEPTIGLDITAKDGIRNFLARLNSERGVTILLASHDVGDIEGITSKIIMINKGEILYDGPLSRITSTFGGEQCLKVTWSQPSRDAATHVQDLLHDLPLLSITSTDTGINISYNSANVRAGEILHRLMNNIQVADVKIQETDVETIIKRLYTGTLPISTSALDET